jgi:hypothetical protein
MRLPGEDKARYSPVVIFCGMATVVMMQILSLPAIFKRFWDDYRSANWEIVPGTVQLVNVSVVRAGLDEAAPVEFAEAELGYSYRTSGETYSGYGHKFFYDEQRAWDFVEHWREKDVMVRRHPRRPEISVLRLSDQAPRVTA